jgi:phosphomethylpyrimidine synthase
MTQLEAAKKNILTPLLKRIAREEGLPSPRLRNLVASGRVVIPHNKNRLIKNPCGIGERLRTKVNANIGTSTDKCSIVPELKKLSSAVKYGADCVMDLSVGGDLVSFRRTVIAHSGVPVGTVPVYEIAVRAQRTKKSLLNFTASDMLTTLEEQAKDGVDFFTLHSGVTRRSTQALINKRRVLGVVSRGGAILTAWIRKNGRENPFYEYFDEILDICRRYDVTLSLGDGLRPGSILDSTDAAQIAELKILGELALRARAENVQVMIEGPGHVPLDQIRKNMELQKKLCHGAPFYVLGPLVTDVASGYDHISSAIGGALAASYGADFLCYVTPSEHLRLPSVEDVREGVIAARIAAHAADLVKNRNQAVKWDRAISRARMKRDWDTQIRLSVDPDKARDFRLSSRPKVSDACTMCGEYCSIKLNEENLRV